MIQCPTTGELFVPLHTVDMDGVTWAPCRCCDRDGRWLGQDGFDPDGCVQWHPVVKYRRPLHQLAGQAAWLSDWRALVAAQDVTKRSQSGSDSALC